MNLGLLTPSLMSSVSDWNANILAYEYPGYGIATGSPTKDTVNHSLHSVYMFARHSLLWPAEKIILFGRSIGSGPTCQIARTITQDHKEQLGGVILLSAFDSLLKVASSYLPASMVSRALKPYAWDNGAQLKHVSTPCLLIHGLQDKTISPSHSCHLLEHLAGDRKQLLMVEGGHDTLDEGIRDDRIRLFLKELLPREAATESTTALTSTSEKDASVEDITSQQDQKVMSSSLLVNSVYRQQPNRRKKKPIKTQDEKNNHINRMVSPKRPSPSSKSTNGFFSNFFKVEVDFTS